MRAKIGGIGLLGACVWCGVAAADPPGQGWQLRWADEFNGNSLDPIKWNTNYPWGPTDNHEAYMSPDHVTVGDGLLNITATRGIPPGAPTTANDGTTTYNLKYTSGAVNTNGKLNFAYGYVEARLKMPATVGTWPAFWTHGEEWPPEIDIQETPFPNTAAMSKYQATYHYGIWQDPQSYGSGPISTGTNLTTGFHNYGVDWEPDHLTFYFDGRPTFTVTDAAAVAQSAADAYLILNLAVGGWPGEPPASAPFPAVYQADWARVWQHAPATTVSNWTQPGNGTRNWDNNAYWSSGAPNLSGQTAVFGNVAAANVQLNWVGSKTVGGLTFQSNTNYTLGRPGQSLMMANPAGRSYIDITGGTGRQSIASRLELYNDVSVRNYASVPFTISGGVIGPGELSLASGPINVDGSITGTSSIQVVSGARVMLNGDIRGSGSVTVIGGQLDALSMHQNALSIWAGGLVRLHASPGPSTVNSLSILGGGTLDLTNGRIDIAYAAGVSPVNAIREYLTSGYAGGSWSGQGIVTSLADAHHTLGYADLADGIINAPPDVVRIVYTRVGDVNLDGSVGFADLLTLVQHYRQSGAGWDEGDLNYDGSVGFADLLAFAQNYATADAAAVEAVPEPAAPTVAALSTLALLGRRRTSQN